MSTSAQSQCATKHKTCRPRLPGLSLALALLALLQFHSGHAGQAFPLFGSARMEATSSVEDAANASTQQTAAVDYKQEPAATLFGMDTEPLGEGEVLNKWSRVKAEIERDRQAVDRCRADGECPAAAQRLIDLSLEGAGRSGRAKVGLINRAVDLSIRPASDEAQWHDRDHWSAPLETLQTGRGDCEDYAIVKYAALLAAGIPERDMKIVILTNAFPNEDHAVLVVRVEGQWLILDNRTRALVRDTDLTRAIPKLVLDQAGVKRFRGRNGRVG
jgi:predicted transglutaminase-like cysteine proteinase